MCIFWCGVPITALTGPGTLRLAAYAVEANGSLVVAEINASSARRPLALMSTCPLSVEIKPGIINAYLQPCLPVFSPGVLYTSPQTHLCVHHSLFSRCLPFSGELSHQNNKKNSISAVRLSTAVEVQRSFIVELLDSVGGWVFFLLIQVPLESLFI